ncbi:MAG TPA: hypothetical protein VG273_08150 [Bryobacteraceae bacterium]|jgi:hypothetical protein|nr:hypothetical protein [Bryobacteraceae bacterium]
MTRRELLAIGPGLLLLNCSSAAPKKVEKAPEPVTGLHALYQMYTFARPWAQDLKVIHLTSINVPEVKADAGKAAAWQVQFASETLGKARTYTFSVYDESVTVRQGIFGDSPVALAKDVHPFELGEVTADSDKAWQLALEHAKKYASEHADMPVTYILEYDRQAGGTIWRVMWGLSAATSSLSVLIDAHTGTYLRTIS